MPPSDLSIHGRPLVPVLLSGEPLAGTLHTAYQAIPPTEWGMPGTQHLLGLNRFGVAPLAMVSPDAAIFDHAIASVTRAAAAHPHGLHPEMIDAAHAAWRAAPTPDRRGRLAETVCKLLFTNPHTVSAAIMTDVCTTMAAEATADPGHDTYVAFATEIAAFALPPSRLFTPEAILGLLTNGFLSEAQEIRSYTDRTLMQLARYAQRAFTPEVVAVLRALIRRADRPERAHTAAKLLGHLLQSPLHRPLLPEVWNELGLVRMEIADRGDSFSTVAPFTQGYLDDLQRLRTVKTDNVIARIPYVTTPTTQAELLRTHRVTSTPVRFGRSFAYPLPDGRWFVIKPAFPNQRGERLVREVQALQRAETLHDLVSPRPQPVTDAAGRVQLFAIDTLGEGIAFVAPPSYYRYISAPDLTDDAVHGGLTAAIHDAFALARQGFIHTVPAPLFHNVEHADERNSDAGRYVFATDIVFPFLDRAGMGRLDNWPGTVLQHPNICIEGIRDWEEVASLGEIAADIPAWAVELSGLGFDARTDAAREYQTLTGIKVDPEDIALMNHHGFLEMSFLCNWLLVAELITGFRIALAAAARPDRPLWEDDAALMPYAERLLALLAAAYAARHQISRNDAAALLRPHAPVLRAARQLAFYMTPAHARYLAPGAKVADFPAAALYESGTVLCGEKGAATFGDYRPGTFHPRNGFLAPSGDPRTLSLGPVNGPFLPRALEQLNYLVFVLDPERGD